MIKVKRRKNAEVYIDVYDHLKFRGNILRQQRFLYFPWSRAKSFAPHTNTKHLQENTITTVIRNR